MLFRIHLLFVIVSTVGSIYESNIKLTSMGFEYQPIENIQLISTNTAQTKLRCSIACNQLPSCRIFDYDSVSLRCRLFEGDLTTGSIISSSSSTSVVGTVRIRAYLYSSIHNQSCQSCEQDRYEACSTNTTTCQCPAHTYWNGFVCALQLFQNHLCSQIDMCRSDLNLTCGSNCFGYPTQCLPSVTFVYNATSSNSSGFGTTIAGACNSSTYASATVLNDQAGILLDSNNTLYVGDNGDRILAFAPNNFTARTLTTFPNWPAFIYLDNRTSNFYITVSLANLVYISPINQTIPPNGVAGTNCSLSTVHGPAGIVGDSAGNIYISSIYCNWITKWAPNATTSTLFAGSPVGNSGFDNMSLYLPSGLALDEANSFLYVADRYNYRIQRFALNGSGVGVPVAGNNGLGTASNQLYRPTDVYVSKIDGSIYIVDCYNSRIQKWAPNAANGTTVAGDPNGGSGSTPYLLNKPYAIAFDNQEKYMYVSDSGNNRIQRFTLQ